MAISKIFLKSCVCFFSLLYSNSIFSQNNDTEYLTNNKINQSGTVLTYYVSSKEGNNLYLNDLKNQKVYKLNNIHQNLILNDNYFIGINHATKTLFTVDFSKQIIDSLIGVDDFNWIKQTNTLLTYNRESKTLKIINLKTGFINVFNDVSLFVSNQVSSNIAFVNDEQTVFYYNTFNHKITKFKNSGLKSKLKKILWDKEGVNIFGFYVENENLKISKYANKSTHFLFKNSIYLKDKNMQIDTMFNNVFMLKGERIAMGVKQRKFSEVNTEEPEIWLGTTNGITPYEDKLRYSNIQLAMFDVKQKKLYDYSELGKSIKFSISGQSEDIYSYEKSTKYDFSRIYPEIEIYEYNKNQPKKNYLGTFNAAEQNIKSSEHSDLLFYFKDNNWNYFDKQSEKSVNITKNLDDYFFNSNNEFYKMIDNPINQYLLLFNNKYLLFNGAKQIWAFDIVKKEMKLIKNNSNRNYSTSQANYTINKTLWDWNITIDQFEYDDIVLTWKSGDHATEGIAILNKEEQIVDILEVNSKIKQIVRGNRKLSYIRENANQPPALYLLDLDTRKETLIFQSNLKDTLAKNIKVVYHNWLNDKNQKRGAVVTYPSNYDPLRIYPAIFDIYEQKKSTQHSYVSTYLTDGNGINSRTYSDDGFFVIRPDIYYEIESPGSSAVNCVIDVLDRLIETLPIDVNNIGLIGHSFGGYQTNFILTKTDRFKTAVSSSGVADIISSYFTFSLEYKIPDMFRYETQQFRMGTNFFDSKNKYMENSPLFHADKINTPLLLLTGKNDYIVNWNQSITMFLALKRLNKTVNLVLYPNEGHVLMKRKNIIDSSNKIKTWFDYHLKGMQKPDWLE